MIAQNYVLELSSARICTFMLPGEASLGEVGRAVCTARCRLADLGYARSGADTHMK